MDRKPGSAPGDFQTIDGALFYIAVDPKAETLLQQRHHHVRFSLLCHGLGTDRLAVNVVACSVRPGGNADHLVIFNHSRHLDHLADRQISAPEAAAGKEVSIGTTARSVDPD